MRRTTFNDDLAGMRSMVVLLLWATCLFPQTLKAQEASSPAKPELTFDFWQEGKETTKNVLPTRVACISISSDETILAAGCEDNSIRVWSLKSSELKSTLTQHSGRGIDDVCFSSDGVVLASAGGYDQSIGLWNCATEKLVTRLTGHPDAVRSVAISPDSRILASGDGELMKWPAGEVRLWDLRARKLSGVLGDKLTTVQSLAFSPDGALLAAGGVSIRVWDVKTKVLKHTLDRKLKGGSVTCVAFSPDGAVLAASDERGFELYDLKNGKSKTAEEIGCVASVAFSPAGDLLACAGGEWGKAGRITIYEVATGAIRQRLTGYRNLVTSVAFFAAGRRVAAGSAEGTITVWDMQRGRLIVSFLVLPSGEKGVSSDWIAFTPEGYYHGCKKAKEFLRWRIADEVVVSEEHARTCCRPDLLRECLELHE
jgi:WD40 repeat protein